MQRDKGRDGRDKGEGQGEEEIDAQGEGKREGQGERWEEIKRGIKKLESKGLSMRLTYKRCLV